MNGNASLQDFLPPSVCSCQLDSASLRLHLAVWRPPYGEKGRNHLLQASLQGFPGRPSAHASSIPPPCGSISLYGVRHMEKKAGTTFCKPAYKLVPAFFSA